MNNKDKNTENKNPSFKGVGEASGETLKILVIQQKMLGDVLTSSIICENLKLNFPEAEIHYLVNRFALPVVEGNPCVDEFVVFEEEYRKNKFKFYKFIKEVAAQNYTHVFDAYAKLESLLISRFSKAKHRFGFKKSYSKFYYTQTVEIKNKSDSDVGSAIENRLRLLKLMPDITVLKNKPKIYLEKRELEKAKSKIDQADIGQQKLIMISALGSNKSKTYPLEYMASLLDEIVSETDSNLILNYIPSQQNDIDSLINYCKTTTQNHLVLDIEMRNIRDFMGVCKQCDAIIGNEGGAINMAKALDVPSFSIFSPWIIKEGWNSFEKHHPNRSVHLSDFEENLLLKNNIKYIKNNVDEFYKKLKPELIKDNLIQFLKSNVN